MKSLSEADKKTFDTFFTRLKSGVNIHKALSESLYSESNNFRNLNYIK